MDSTAISVYGVAGTPLALFEKFKSTVIGVSLGKTGVFCQFQPFRFTFSSRSSDRARGSVGFACDDDANNVDFTSGTQLVVGSATVTCFKSGSPSDGLRGIRSCALLTRSLRAIPVDKAFTIRVQHCSERSRERPRIALMAASKPVLPSVCPCHASSTEFLM